MCYNKNVLICALFGFLISILSIQKDALASQVKNSNSKQSIDLNQFSGLKYRFVGPMVGGRVNAVVGHPTKKTVAYAGFTGGGVWMTTDAGSNWENISDGQIHTGSIGAIDISLSNPDILYVGTGEHALRGDVSHGDGVYKSVDGGKTWTNKGLKETRQIARILIHPSNPDIVYVAAIGHFAGPNPERGVYRTRDGGDTWEQILFQDEKSGVIDLEMDRKNPELMYAATWEVQRFPWGIRSGGEGSRIYRSKDGGDTWEEITNNPGMPKAKIRERIGLALTEAKEGRVYALISSDAGKGLYRSDDGGDTWQFMTDDVRLFARAYYYMHITADPSIADRVYVSAEELFRSDDGGKTFKDINREFSDHQDFWIDPNDSDRLIDGQDHGVLLSYNGGKTWSANNNQPTAQIYSLTTDNQFPYWLYGHVQDWGSYKVSSRPRGSRNRNTYEFRTASSEGGYTALNPDSPNLLFLSNHHWMHRVDQNSGDYAYISPRDELNYGWGTADQKYRFFWVFPVIWSQHSGALYTGSQYVHKSTDEGYSWQIISPDLTAAEKETMEKTPLRGHDTSDNGPYWGPLTRDSNGDNWNATIYTIAESPLQAGLIWTGSDDGLIHITTNDGKTWQNVTPPDLPSRTVVARIDPSPKDPATAYVAAMRYKVDDMSPIIYRTHDYGKTWTKITKGIPKDDFVRVVRADREKEGLLFAGTETGVYFSLNNGDQWLPLRLNLPHVPVHDMQIKNSDLVLATHGRGFWILDDISLFRQIPNDRTIQNHLFKPQNQCRYRPLHKPAALASPQSYGIFINYMLDSPDHNVEIRFREANGDFISSFINLPSEQGLNRFVWKNQRYPGAEELLGHPTRSSRNIGPFALPGDYKVELVVDNEIYTEEFKILPDPNSSATQKDLEKQFKFVSAIRDTITHINHTVLAIREIRSQLYERDKTVDNIFGQVHQLDSILYNMETVLTSYEAKYRMQYHAIPIKLDDKLYALAGRAMSGERPPTEAQISLFDEYVQQYTQVLTYMFKFIENDLGGFNDRLNSAGAEQVSIPAHIQLYSSVKLSNFR